VTLSTGLKGQDLQLTQFYASPLYLNPAFTGANSDSRLATVYRSQWASIPGTYNSFLLSFDYYFHNLRSGAGIIILSDKAGTAGLSNNGVIGSYAYDYKFHRDWSLTGGLAFGYKYRSLDFDRLVFGDQIARGGAAVSLQAPTLDRRGYLDVNAGVLLYSYRYWVGLALNHLTKPQESLLGGSGSIPVKSSFHGGVSLPIEKGSGDGKKVEKPRILAAFNYRFQEKYDQIDLGVYYKTPRIFAGVWYRGIPGFKRYREGLQNHDALALLAGGVYKGITIGYSYDITISLLSISTGGAHEISVSYSFYNPRKPKKKRTKIIPCPKF
jgi:type IX secretion system PorP/SprF family membrane protein